MRLTYSVFIASIISGCAAVGGPPSYQYVRIFDSQTSLEQAKAQCEYELQLQKAADKRMDASYISIDQLRGLPHPIEAACMKRFGFGYEKL